MSGGEAAGREVCGYRVSTCARCGGTGEIVGLLRHPFTCPHCRGRRTVVTPLHAGEFGSRQLRGETCRTCRRWSKEAPDLPPAQGVCSAASRVTAPAHTCAEWSGEAADAGGAR